ncbi:hypothetical protein PHISP_03135 [Aspergillus sp. HF37]|nr:hypothetical protein PHISP_03135 [Aspergillus sp. HF37]
MERIPQEILLCILDHLYQPTWSRCDRRVYREYANVSRRWQRAIERELYAELNIQNTELSTFAHLFREGQAHRKALVREIRFAIELPTYDGDDCHQHEELNNQVFSEAFFALFRVLESFNDDKAVLNSGGLELRLHSVLSPSDRFFGLTSKSVWSSIMQVLNHQDLPLLSCVSSFCTWVAYKSRKCDPISAMLLASKFDRLRYCWIDFPDSQQWCGGDEAHIIIRNDFAKALAAYTHSLDSLRITFERNYSPSNEACAPPNFIPPSASADQFNVGLHKFIQHANISEVLLKTEHLISPDLFWLPDTAESASFWPNLKTITIEASSITPDGDWYFIGDPNVASYDEFSGVFAQEHESSSSHNGERGDSNKNSVRGILDNDDSDSGDNGMTTIAKNDGYNSPRSISDSDVSDSGLPVSDVSDDDNSDSDDTSGTAGDEDENSFRSIPNPAKMNPLLLAMAQAVQHAPSLQRIRIYFSRFYRLRPKYLKKGVELIRHFYICYFAKGEVDYDWESRADKNRLDDVITVEPRDAVQQRIYLGLYVTVDAGTFTHFTLSVPDRRLTLGVADAVKGIDVKKAKVEYTANNATDVRFVGTQLDETNTGPVFEFQSGHASLTFAWETV